MCHSSSTVDYNYVYCLVYVQLFGVCVQWVCTHGMTASDGS